MTEKIILGIDEVGRGPWAGPLVVGAVILGPDFKDLPEYAQLTDSKKLTAKKREILNGIILERAAATGLGWVPAAEIDRYGLGPALKLAARRAVKPILAKLSENRQLDAPSPATTEAQSAPSEPRPTPLIQRFDEILIDGTINLLAETPLADRVSLLPKADFLIKEVSAASIIAKVARDRYMTDLAAQYPGYAFEKHVGYGTAAHKAALLALGPCPEHRKSFRPIAELLKNASPSPTGSASSIPVSPTSSVSPSTRRNLETATARGQKAEQIVAKHLETLRHTIIAHNFKTKSYEIDLISTAPAEATPDAQPAIYFT